MDFPCARWSLTALLVAALPSVGTSPALAGPTGSTGGDVPFSVMEPSLAIQWLIATDGVTSGVETGGVLAGGATMIGELRLFAYGLVPGGWVRADGSVHAMSTFPILGGMLGATYGGNGTTTFAVPDLRGRTACGIGAGPGLSQRSLGDAFGSETRTLVTANLPAHSHTLPTGGSTGSTGTAPSGTPWPLTQPTLAIRAILNPFGDFEDLPEVRFFAAPFDPGSWLACQGQTLAISEYDALFQQIGTTYGGDGVETFALPDLSGRVPIGSGQGPGLAARALGDSFGAETAFLDASRMTTHAHTLAVSSTGDAGSSTSIPLHQPTLTIELLIAVSGIYPSEGTSTNQLSQPILGELRAFAGPFIPPAGEWVRAQGQTLQINQNATLYSLIQTTYGGDGQTNFKLPDLRGRTPIGAGSGPGLTPRSLGAQVGADGIVPAVGNLPAHLHTQPAPEIDLSFSGTPIADGDVTPSTGEGTLFPSTAYTSFSSRTFTLRNFGAGDLVLTGTPRVAVTGDAAFSVSTQPPVGAVEPAGATSFTVRFAPRAYGTATATLSIASDDANEAIYDFRVEGTGIDGFPARHPGSVAAPLMVQKAGGQVQLSWGASCAAEGGAFAIYEGTLGSFASHALVPSTCMTSATSRTFTPLTGDRYFLVSTVDVTAQDEGSLGTSSAGVEIPPPASRCMPVADVVACP